MRSPELVDIFSSYWISNIMRMKIYRFTFDVVIKAHTLYAKKMGFCPCILHIVKSNAFP